jgi:hypothetical protein
VSWSLRFRKPILLADGGKVASLRKAIAHLVKIIPAAERGSPAVLTAAELLTNAAEHGGPIEFARIATLQALNRNVVCDFNSDPNMDGTGLRFETKDPAGNIPTRCLRPSSW